MNSELTRRRFLGWVGAGAAAGVVARATRFVHAAEPGDNSPAAPNIVYILADDLGYGDVDCLNPDRGKIPTPNIDRLAQAGMKFTDAHSGSAVCTPTRYGILTGRYCWRTHLARGVLYGYSAPLIAANRLTVPALLKSRGYHTAGFGKWHLGLGMATTDGAAPKGDGSNVDFSKPLTDAPTSHGFDEYFGISASLDMPPFVYIHNDRFTAVPTTYKKFQRRGLAAEDFEAVDVVGTVTDKAIEYIDARAKAQAAGDNSPFFVYLPLTSPHTPIVPTKEFAGKSGLNGYADFVMQTDAMVGKVLDALDRNNLTGDTLVIMTSDNGCSPAANFKVLEEMGHYPSYVFRGEKADIFEGGHRIPFIARRPGHIAPGTQSDQTICLTDLMATVADMLDVKLPDNAGEDSVSILPALQGKAEAPLREATVHHSINGSFAIRQGKWKLEMCPDSGGWSDPKPGSPAAQTLPAIQLYDMTADIAERQNVEADHPDVVAHLKALLQSYVDQGRGTPGAKQPNDRDITIESPRYQRNR